MAERGKPLTLEELFTEQSKPKFVGTVELGDEPNFVKITPYSENSGCQCNISIVVPKAAIEVVVPTGTVRPCCGQNLAVVEITFSQGATMPIADAVAQWFAQAAPGAAARHLGHAQMRGVNNQLLLRRGSNSSLQPGDDLACYWCLDNAHWAYIDALVACRNEEAGAPRTQCIQRAKAGYAAQQSQCFIMSCGYER